MCKWNPWKATRESQGYAENALTITATQHQLGFKGDQVSTVRYDLNIYTEFALILAFRGF
jgi:hypothetical protein